MTITFHIISHTHWDREWYLPFETFRFELVHLIDSLLDILEHDSNFIFHLDGQTIILKDYLEIRPEKEDVLKKYIKQKRLQTGPWYVLSDQFLTSGEATIRNLLYGIRDAEYFGNVMKIGYCPDQFGNIAQLPQIFKGFDIDSVIIGRGIQDFIAEHYWYGLNGDYVFAILLTNWYNNAQKIPENETTQYIEKIYKSQVSTTKSNHLLLMNGCDHLFPQQNLSYILKTINKNGCWEIKQNSLYEAVKEISKSPQKEKYPLVFGELRDDNNKYILAGTLSARVYLKLANYRCQTKLEKTIEPLLTMQSLYRHPAKMSLLWSFVNYAWRLLIQNHAHDSICGCSVDEVHREMEIRFTKIEQVLEKIKEDILFHLNDSTYRDVATQRLYTQLINPTQYHRNEAIEAELEFPLGPPAEHSSAEPVINQPEIKDLKLIKDNRIVPCEVLENIRTFKMICSRDEVPLLQAIQKIKILFLPDIESFSVISYLIEPVYDKKEESKKQESFGSKEFENKSYKLIIQDNGTLLLLFKEKNYLFEELHLLVIEEDLGDEYNFVPNPKEKIIQSNTWKWKIKVTEENQFRKRFMLIPESISNPELKTEIICYNNSARIDFKTQIKSKMKNKRIRLHFPTNLNTNYIACDTPFGSLIRSRPPVTWTNYAYSQPLHNWIDHSCETIGLAFFGGGLADYELYEDGNGFAVTLLRAVGHLSSTRSHSLIETPEAQCNRDTEFCYSIYPHEGTWESAQIYHEALKHQSCLITNQSSTSVNFLSLIQISDKVLASALKKSEDKENLYVLRLFNSLAQKIDACEIKFNFNFKNVYLLSLNEEISSSFNIDKDKICLNLNPYEIITLGIEV